MIGAATVLLGSAAYAADARLTWQPVASASSYRLYVRHAGQNYGAGTNIGLPPAGGDGLIRYLVPGLQSGATSYFVVTAVDAGGTESPFSNELSLHVPAPPTATHTYTPPPTRTPTLVPPTKTPTKVPPTKTPTLAPPTKTPTRDVTQPPSATPTRTPTLGSTRYDVSGRIRYYGDDAAVAAAHVHLTGTVGTAMAMSDDSGSYRFESVAPGSWQVYPEKQGDFQYGVSALDAARVLQAVSGMRTLDTVASIACDVTGNGTLTAVDAARILQLSVGAIPRLPVAEACASDFLFMPEPMSSPAGHPIAPLFTDGVCQPGAIRIDPLTTDVQQDFAAAAFGDCTGNWGLNAAPATASASTAAEPSFDRVRQVWASLGPPSRDRSVIWRVPLFVVSNLPVDAIDVEIDYDPTFVRFDSMQLVGPARNAIARQHSDASGHLKIGIASAKPLRLHRKQPIAFLTFRSGSVPQLEPLLVTANDTEAMIIRD